MSDTGSSGDNKPQQDEVSLVSSAAAVPEVENKPVTPAKRTPSKRTSAVERAQRESEELVKILGGNLDIEGGRKTRSSTRGTPSRSNVVDTPPPTKKARGSANTPRRPRGRKLDTTIEGEAKTTPEKISSEPESIKEEDESSTVDADKAEDKTDDSEAKANSSAAEEKKSPAKQDVKPEPMEVDGGGKDDTVTPGESEPVAESVQKTTESAEKVHDEKSKDSDKVVTEQEQSSSVVEDDDSSTPVEEVKSCTLENKVVENSLGNNVEVNNSDEKANSLPTEVSPPTPPPAPPVSVAGNDHKAESNDFCEPKIASPPITANNDGATPQYCN